MKKAFDNLDKGSIGAIMIITVIIIILSLVLFPQWKSSLAMIIVLVSIALAGVMAFIANFRTATKKSQNNLDDERVINTELLNVTVNAPFMSNAVVTDYLHQLPSTPYDFSGRVEQLNTLRMWFDKENIRAFCIWGMPGIGKTTLASKLCAIYSDIYSDAQLFLDLKGNRKNPATSIELLNHIRLSFEPQESYNDDLDVLNGIVRSILHDKKCLVFLDNVNSEKQFTPIFTNHNHLLIVTSQTKFSFPGMKALHLDNFSQKEAFDFFQSLIKIDDNLTNHLVELCGKHPLAIRLAGNILSENIDLDPCSFIDNLKKVNKPWKLIEPSLFIGYQALSKEDQSYWTMLSIFENKFTTSEASQIWDISNQDAQEKLSLFVRNSMLSWDEKVRKYFFHDLVRDFSIEYIKPEDLKIAKSRKLIKHKLYIRLIGSGDKQNDIQEVRTLHGILIASKKLGEKSNDSFCFLVNEGGTQYEINFPNVTINITPSLLEKLGKLIGKQNLKIEASLND